MLLLDAIINLLIGFLLLVFPLDVFQLLGLPVEAPPFYANILGAVLVGIGIALLTEHFGTSRGTAGLGLGGAVVINLYAALILVIWLVGGRLNIPLRGHLVLWGLVIVLVAISGVELRVQRNKKDGLSRADDTHRRSSG